MTDLPYTTEVPAGTIQPRFRVDSSFRDLVITFHDICMRKSNHIMTHFKENILVIKWQITLLVVSIFVFFAIEISPFFTFIVHIISILEYSKSYSKEIWLLIAY